jgi:inhibitor of cysteine peptidase
MACALAIVSLVACAQPHKVMQVDESSNGKTVTLHVGDSLKVALTENASTGYRWMVTAQLDNILRQVSDTSEGQGSPPGKPGVRVIGFEAGGPGTIDLTMEYRRHWERDTPAARQFQLHVVVQ